MSTRCLHGIYDERCCSMCHPVITDETPEFRRARILLEQVETYSGTLSGGDIPPLWHRLYDKFYLKLEPLTEEEMDTLEDSLEPDEDDADGFE